MRTQKVISGLMAIILLAVFPIGGSMSGIAIEQLEQYSLSTRLDEWVAAGSTVITFRAPIDLVTGETTQFKINPGEATEETVTVSAVQGREATVGALTYAHAAGELCVRQVQISASNIANRTRNIFVPVNGVYSGGAVVARTDTDAEGYPMADAVTTYAFADLYVPEDFVSGGVMDVVLISNASGNMYGAYRADYGTLGESYIAHSDVFGPATVGLTALQLSRPASMQLILDELAAGDYVSITLLRQGGHADDTIGNTVYIKGFIFSYTADS